MPQTTQQQQFNMSAHVAAYCRNFQKMTFFVTYDENELIQFTQSSVESEQSSLA